MPIEGCLRIERAFDLPVEFQFFQEGDTVWLRTIVKSNTRGFEWGEIVRDDRIELSRREASQLRQSLDEISKVDSMLSQIPGSDGSMRSLSLGSTEVKLFSPSPKGRKPGHIQVHALGEFLWKLSAIEGRLY